MHDISRIAKDVCVMASFGISSKLRWPGLFFWLRLHGASVPSDHLRDDGGLRHGISKVLSGKFNVLERIDLMREDILIFS